ncbi:beta-hydroxylase [Planctomycetales bacterium]|nr:beta-hydroxylase [Planctomycetales bacterium]
MPLYLANLTARIFSGVMKFNDSRREELKTFFLSAQSDNGGFHGRNGEADIYYTAFALRGLFLLGALNDAELTQKISAFLEAERCRKLSAAELTSLIFSLSLIHLSTGSAFSEEQVQYFLGEWERFRTSDGCFAASDKTSYSSSYTTFLAAVSLELLGAEDICNTIPVEPILDRQRSDGGFVELLPLHRSGTNPTAACIGFLTLRDVELRNRQDAICFLRRQQSGFGGFTAHSQIPVPDLLSSFSAAAAFADMNAADQYDVPMLQKFVADLRSPCGGYFGVIGDRQCDVEYTFYGLALEALLRGLTPPSL